MSDSYRKFIDTDRRPDTKWADLRPTERDFRIFEHIHAYGGILTLRHIHELEFPGTNGRACQSRLSRLFHNNYLSRTNSTGVNYCNTMVYWLTAKGAKEIGISSFLAAPVWQQIRHDLLMVDILFCIQKACAIYPEFHVYEWINEQQLRSNAVSIDYVGLNGRPGKQKVVPDAFVTIDRRKTEKGGFRSRLILETDLSTHPNKRFADHKVLPGINWIRSDAYKRQFGVSKGRFLVVTKSDERLGYLKETTENAAGKDAILWYFTTLARLSEHTIFTEPIWYRADGSHEPIALFLPT